MVFGSICAMAVGCVFPLFTIIFGKILDILNDPASMADKAKQAEGIRSLCIYFFIIAIVSGVFSFFETFIPVRVTESVLERIRHEYMKSLLRQDMAWHDTTRSGEATARMAESTLQVSAGMEKICSLLKAVCTLLCGIIIGFTTSWRLTLVIMGCAPFFAVSMGVLIFSITKAEGQSQKAYARAGDVAGEVYANIRTVAAYSGERHEVRRYDRFLAHAEAAGVHKGAALGFSLGLMLFSFYAMYGVSTYAGAEFIVLSREADPLCAVDYGRDGCFTGGKVVQTFVAVLLGALSFGNIGPTIGALVAAQAAAFELYEIIDRVPGIDIQAQSGHSAPLRGKVHTLLCPPSPLTPSIPHSHLPIPWHPTSPCAPTPQTATAAAPFPVRGSRDGAHRASRTHSRRRRPWSLLLACYPRFFEAGPERALLPSPCRLPSRIRDTNISRAPR